MSNTIVALATPLGRSGIGVVRLSGPESLPITRGLIADAQWQPEVRVASLRKLRDLGSGEVLDEAVITFFEGPNSFTGENVIELSCHGSPVLLRQIIDLVLKMGARLAGPGEFSLRGLQNGRMDLTEAEAIRDLIDAQSTAAARQAVRQMSGELSDTLQPLKERLLDLVVILESALEFIEDDLPAAQLDQVNNSLVRLGQDIRSLGDTFRQGHLIRDGLRVVIVGRPNVGKSSLFNALLGSERAIVTDVAGTTRDELHERFLVGDVPISLIDTAGLRETADTVESIGVDRARAAMADADLVVVLLDASCQTSDEDRQILKAVESSRFVIAINKIDLARSTDVERMAAAEHSSFARVRASIVPISAKTGEGLDELRSAIVAPFGSADASTDGFLITDARHHDLLNRAAEEIDDASHELVAGSSEEIVLVGMHNALRYLGELTGETTTEDVLTRIFSTFCIGK